jgi:alkylhydroperoxidase family enzyme
MPRIEPVPWDALSPETVTRLKHTIEKGNSPPEKTTARIMAYAEHQQAPDDSDRHFNFPQHLLGGKLLEMLRIRSAQLGGCGPCMDTVKVEGVTEDVVACLLSPSLRSDLTERERRAIEFLDLLATDHHKIDDETYRGLAEVFTTAEIVELGSTCGNMIGTHRFLHTLDPYGETPPVIGYDPAQVGVTWSELHGDPSPKDRAAV